MDWLQSRTNAVIHRVIQKAPRTKVGENERVPFSSRHVAKRVPDDSRREDDDDDYDYDYDLDIWGTVQYSTVPLWKMEVDVVELQYTRWIVASTKPMKWDYD